MKINLAKKYFITLLLVTTLVLTPKLFAQNIAINTTGNLPDTSAMLDITSTNQGFLMPRMTATQMTAIILPANGLLIFNTTLNAFEVNLGTSTSPNWAPIGTSQYMWGTSGNSGTNTSSNFIGTTDGAALAFKVNNLPAGFIDSTGGKNITYFGLGAGNQLTSTGYQNAAMGGSALAQNTSGYQNTAMGSWALTANTVGYQNAAIGPFALASNKTGAGFVAVGDSALGTVTSGSLDVAVGVKALCHLVTGGNNVAVGYQALFQNTAGSNTAVGTAALNVNTSGANNVAMGSFAMQNNTTGIDNTALGTSASRSNTTGSNNTGIGRLAINGNTIGSYNTAMGWRAGYTNTNGSNNTTLGWEAGYNNNGGNNNTMLGYLAGTNGSGSNNIAIGASTNLAITGNSNQLNIGNNIFGTNLTGSVSAPAGQIGIGTNAPNATLHTNGTIAITSTTSGIANSVVLLNGGIFSTPAAAVSNAGVIYFIRNTSTSATVTVQSIIDYNASSAADFPLTPTTGAIMITSDGANWYRIQ